ncbi:lipase family protein [Sorangium sp. So ce131]|uniref:lipase family protein n=1 Tax=Sorangium sp. So ce131 TaxID=3133282 RepID=UPI003F647D01
MKNERLWSSDGVLNHVVDDRVADTFQRAISSFPAEWAAAAARVKNDDVVKRLVSVSPGAYSHNATSILASVAAWSYSPENEDIVNIMELRGLPCICVSKSFQNQGLLMDSLVHILQSRDGRVVILAFRGSQLEPITNWLANINIKPDPFFAAGRVHGSFYRGILSVWPSVREHLLTAKNGESICRVWQRTTRSKVCAPSMGDDSSAACGEVPSLREQDPRCVHRARLRTVMGALEEALRSKLEALYITGHSLGGALAVLAAAMIYSEEELRDLRPLLRGIYTFGQPMVGDRAFARNFQKHFGHMLFRHIYDKDVVPHLPPRTAGDFEHFGQEYKRERGGWVSSDGASARQARFGALALAGSLASWLAEQFPIDPLFPDVGRMAWVKRNLMPPILHKRWWLRYSMADHMPINYLRTSREVPPGSEFL